MSVKPHEALSESDFLMSMLMDGLLSALEVARRGGGVDPKDIEHLVGLAIDLGEIYGRLEWDQTAALAQDTIRRASGGGST